jgi:hypothetical protein
VRAFSSSVVFPELVGIHLAQAFVALQRQSVPAPTENGVQQLGGRANLALLVFVAEYAALQIGRLQFAGHAVELARIRARYQRAVDGDRLRHSAHFAAEFQPAIGRRLAAPAALCLVR